MKISVEDRELMWAARQMGWSVQRIADYFAISTKSVRRILADEDILRDRIRSRQRPRAESVA